MTPRSSRTVPGDLRSRSRPSCAGRRCRAQRSSLREQAGKRRTPPQPDRPTPSARRRRTASLLCSWFFLLLVAEDLGPVELDAGRGEAGLESRGEQGVVRDVARADRELEAEARKLAGGLADVPLHGVEP